MPSSDLTQKHQRALLVQRRALETFETALPPDRARDKVALVNATRTVDTMAKDLTAGRDRGRPPAPGPQRPTDRRRKPAPKPLAIAPAHAALLRELLKDARYHEKLF